MSQMEQVRTGDEILVSGIQRGDATQETKFVIKFRDRICSMLERMTGDRDRAEDLTHDTLVLVLQKIREKSIRNPDRLTGYTFSTARFMYYGWLRKMDNQVALDEDLDRFAMLDADSPDLMVFQEERHQALRVAMEQLSVDRDREIIELHYFREREKCENCKSMLLSREHYDRVLSRARKRLGQHVSVEYV